MAKLYELLAVEPDLGKKGDECLKWVRSVFGTPSLLTGQVISYHPIVEDAQELPDERTELGTNVDALLLELQNVFGNFMNVSVQKELTNPYTHAVVELDGSTFFADFPATALLNLEKKLEDLRKVYEAIPVLDPTERWGFSESQNCYVSDVREAYRTKKTMRSFVAYEATKEHPAQVETYTEDIPTHKRETIVSSGMITQKEKSERLARLDALYQAVKQARQRSNDIDAQTVNVADKIFAYINKGSLE